MLVQNLIFIKKNLEIEVNSFTKDKSWQTDFDNLT